MATKKPSLGRNLGALLTASMITSPSSEPESSHALLEIALSDIVPGKYQPRREFHQPELEALANSIRAQGVLQPIVVRSLRDKRYEIIAGERRWRASQLAGLTEIPALIKDVPEEAAMAIALIENIQRENLTALEEAMALDRLSKEFGLTHIQVAESVGKSRSAITNLLRLLTLSDDVKLMLEQGDIEVGHAKALLGLRGHNQSQIAKMIVQKGLSVRETERVVARFQEESSLKPKSRVVVDPNVRALQNSLSEKLGAEVEIVHGQQGRGKVVIQYNSLDELDGILAHIQ